MISGFLLHIHVKKNHYSEIRIHNLIWLLFPVWKKQINFLFIINIFMFSEIIWPVNLLS